MRIYSIFNIQYTAKRKRINGKLVENDHIKRNFGESRKDTTKKLVIPVVQEKPTGVKTKRARSNQLERAHVSDNNPKTNARGVNRRDERPAKEAPPRR